MKKLTDEERDDMLDRLYGGRYLGGTMDDIDDLKNFEVEKRKIKCKKCKELKIGTPEFVLCIAVLDHMAEHIENEGLNPDYMF